MSREIKFRAWDKMGGLWVNPVEVALTAGGDPLLWNEEFFDEDDAWEPLLMQYTGLKDRNGVEIYEGDIVRFPTYPNTGSIVWADGFCGWAISDSELEHRISAYVIQRDVEVIGNIYENPDALGTNGKEGDK